METIKHCEHCRQGAAYTQATPAHHSPEARANNFQEALGSVFQNLKEDLKRRLRPTHTEHAMWGPHQQAQLPVNWASDGFPHNLGFWRQHEREIKKKKKKFQKSVLYRQHLKQRTGHSNRGDWCARCLGSTAHVVLSGMGTLVPSCSQWLQKTCSTQWLTA